jgi:hypothetical protein
MFRSLLAHPQEALNKRHLVYCVRVMSVGSGTVTLHVGNSEAQKRFSPYGGKNLQ